MSDPTAPTRQEPAPPAPRARETFERGAVVDRYTILERLGKGGMGEVYAAYDAKLDRRVALKLLLSSGPVYEARLAREAQAMARLSHPNVVAVFDTGVVEGRLFLAMEFVEGTTLRGWQRASPRGLAETLRVYVEAGRGLSAAHEAGLVHRDFKPDNVLVSTAGAVKVTDFGIVRAAEETSAATEDALERLAAKIASSRPPPPASGANEVKTTSLAVTRGAAQTSPASTRSPASFSISGGPSSSSGPMSASSLETPMTEFGVLLGTLGYMAPEQYLSQPVNARTDQFAFCVALYAALYGQKPFAGDDVLELAEAAVNGRVREPPKGTRVPSRIHRALLRGLQPENERRYPSMQALLDELVRDPPRQRLRIGAGLFAVLAALALVVWTQRRATARQGRLCSGAEALAHEVWNDDVRRDVERAMLATGVPFAADTWARTRAELDAYMGRWSAMHEQTCRATRVDGHQPEALMAIREGCLEQRRGQVRALTHLLAEADRQTVEKAVEATRNLPSVADCADITALTTVKALPAAPEQRAAIEALRREVGDLRVRADAGKYKEAVALAPALVARAHAVAYEPLEADALFVQGDVQDHLGMKAEAANTLREAVYAAEAGRAEDLKVRALITLFAVLADQRKFDDAAATGRLASAASERLGDPEAHRADWYSANAWVLCRKGKFEESAAEFRRAVTAAEQTASDPNPVRLARIYSRAGGMLGDAGQFDEAFDLLDRADATFVRVLGPDHPARVATAVNRSAALLSAGRWSDAVATADAALALSARILPPGSGTFANLHTNRAGALCQLGRFEEALASGQRAVEIGRALFGPKAVTTMGYVINMAEALAGLGRDDEAVASFGEVLAVLEPTLPPDHEWLAEVRAGRGAANVGLHLPRMAIADLERALAAYGAIAHKTAPARANEALAQGALARALWETGVRTGRVGELAESARSSFVALHDDARARDVAAWAKAHAVASRRP